MPPERRLPDDPLLTVTTATPADLDEVLALLQTVGLSGNGVAEGLSGFLVAREGGRLVAVAGLEDHGLAGLLRSVAVAPDRRSRGIAAGLVRMLIERSRASGHRALYLRTDGAEPYFERLGFRRVTRDRVDPAVLASVQFRGQECDRSTVMVLEPGP